MLANALYYTGALFLWQRLVLRRRAVVLMYHRVLDEDDCRRTGSHPGIIVAPDTFERQMAVLKRRFFVLSAGQLAEHLTRNIPLPDSSCVITFDDGWRDNLTNALPVLRAHGLPAIVFLPVNFIGRRRLFWREAVTHLLLKAVQLSRAGDLPAATLQGILVEYGLAQVLDITDPDPRPALIETVQRQSHRRMQDDGALVHALEEAMDIRLEDLDTADVFVSWEQVREMEQSGISFGAHGVEHRLLGELPPADADREIRESRRVVASHVTAPVFAFSYPNGSFTSEVTEMVRAAGYQLGFTTEPGFAQSGDDRFRIRRVNVHEDATYSAPLFLSRILGLF
jgi:peptidoglycan/xylan/chitin deacetylase (PgdA/CDA1 family)